MNTSAENLNEGWETCPPGELQRLVRGTRWRRQARIVRSTLAIGGGLVAVSLAVWIGALQLGPLSEPPQHGPYIAGVCCDDVRREMPDLIAKRVEPQRAEQLNRHISQCPDCRQRMQELEAKVPLSVDEPSSARQRLLVLQSVSRHALHN